MGIVRYLVPLCVALCMAAPSIAQTVSNLSASGTGTGSYDGSETTTASGTLEGKSAGTWQFNFTSIFSDGNGKVPVGCGPGAGTLVLTEAQGTVSLSLVGWVCQWNGSGQPLNPNVIHVGYAITGGTGKLSNVIGGTGTVAMTLTSGTSAVLYVNGNIER